jgi:hypothetical protein
MRGEERELKEIVGVWLRDGHNSREPVLSPRYNRDEGRGIPAPVPLRATFQAL